MVRACMEDVEIWRDNPAAEAQTHENILIAGRQVPVRGAGNGRTVFAYRHEARCWIGK